MLLVEQDMLTLPGHKSRFPVFSEVLSVLFFPSLFVILSFFNY